MADKYILKVTAGPGYDTADHVSVPVNDASTVKISSELADVELNVRIQNYGGLPRGSDKTSSYFSTEPHKANNDQYSICLRFTPKKPEGSSERGISGEDLQFGNDFDHPIRDHLPPGFQTALNIVKWLIDPGLEGDAYADAPYLFGPALSSFNTIYCGRGSEDAEKGGLVFEEGGDEKGGSKGREEVGAPGTGKERMKWALKAENKKAWVWEFGRTYGLDFFNPYLDFERFALRLPGFRLSILRYWDGQGLRYVLRNKQTKETYLVVMFSLYLKEDVNEDGTLKVSEEEAKSRAAIARPTSPSSSDDEGEEQKPLPELALVDKKLAETRLNDVD
ncbi:Uncharacterized protein SAPIO_CDS6177 [Scedosporium apiospermum]|uniref:Domain of unknown function at the cortex 1 domain-containing protein n=1 Tax=Pseudallescheria apiosperma TaxID=563466 RepID=A0A084G4P6_PSEDA|nr:Uncharacterized protein SAPIO_CDS6177 [Scedosporium apiospermum]KEZ42308.1 Uncharacterized protein SAPIO_CDS6177 [Scedosporium apiospermum]